MQWSDWRDAGERIEVHAGGRPVRVWHRVDDDASAPDAPWTTFLHGYPTSSFDWQHVRDVLPPGRRIYLDHLGFGASDKPRMRYTFHAQIAALAQVWKKHGVEATTLVAHDYSVSMAQEILWRRLQGVWDGPDILGLTMLNGGLLYSAQKPLLIQRLLRSPLGPVVAQLAGFSRFRRSMHDICASPPDDEALREHWRSMLAGGGRRALADLSSYHEERRKREADWTAALQHCDVPTQLVWGLADPVSGRRMLDQVKRRSSALRIDAREDVGHYPQLEDPAWVARAVQRMEARATFMPSHS